MKIVTADAMRSIDRYCIEKLAIPSLVLMENAALKVLKNIDMKEDNFVIVCGKGNNGGDGFVIARHLYVLGKSVEVFLIGTEEGMSKDCEVNCKILKNLGIKVNKINNVEDVNDFRESVIRSRVTVDAIFGTGLSKNVEGIYDLVISIINENSSYILAVDVPSGFDSNTGKILGNCVKANKTVSFQLYKKGFLSYGADTLTGEIVIEEIGIPQWVIDKFHKDEFIIDEEMIRKGLVVREKYGHKVDYGRTLIIAGSKGFTGAAYIATEGAVRCGAGLVTLACSEEIIDVMSSKVIEAMTLPLNDKNQLDEVIAKSNAIAIGPGMGAKVDTLQLVREVIQKAQCPVVIDADGINVLKDNLQLLKECKNKIIITPHLGEMARITGLSIEYIKENRMEVAKAFAEEHEVIVLLKGYNTIITDGKTTIVNPTGNSSMASGGMGDCLTGMVASFLAQGYKLLEAVYIAAYIHGYCGEKLSKDMFCVNASHVLEELPRTIKECI